jgi:hypothetical protein
MNLKSSIRSDEIRVAREFARIYTLRVIPLVKES